MKKKILIALASAFAFLGLVSCDNSNNDATDTTPKDQTTETTDKEQETKKDTEEKNPTTTALSAPTITLNEKTVSWEAVANATGYVVNVNGTDLPEQVATTYISTETTVGEYSVKVKAISSNSAYTASGYSSTVTITVEEAVADTKQYDAKPEIFLAGDSTVKTYETDQYIAGWGQYLGLYLPDDVVVHNAAQGGRSSRSFINEGRLYDTKEEGFCYTFKENGGKSIESQIGEGDFLFIQFGHNDDNTKTYTDLTYQYQRFVPLGSPNAQGIYPTVKPTNKQSTADADLPADMPSGTVTEVKKYGANYFAYDAIGENGTYKGYLKEYIDLARSKGATPVLVTPVSRVKFNSEGHIISGEGLHGYGFAYVQAVRQLAEEEDCLLVDLFDFTKTALETVTSEYSDFLMALKPNSLTGEWPAGFDAAYHNTALGYTGMEATHYNKYGAFISAAYVASCIKTDDSVAGDGTEYYTFRDTVLNAPTSYIAPSYLMAKTKILAAEALIEGVTVTDPGRVFPTTDAIEAVLAQIPAVDNITADNYLAVGELAEQAEELYNELNIEDKKEEYKTKIDATKEKVALVTFECRPIATETIKLDPSDLTETKRTKITSTTACGSYSLVATSTNSITVQSGTEFSYNYVDYDTTKSLYLGTANFSDGAYIQITTTKKATVTVVAKSASTTTPRVINMVNASGTVVETFAANSTAEVISKTDVEAGTYKFGSSDGAVYIFMIIIEYFD